MVEKKVLKVLSKTGETPEPQKKVLEGELYERIGCGLEELGIYGFNHLPIEFSDFLGKRVRITIEVLE